MRNLKPKPKIYRLKQNPDRACSQEFYDLIPNCWCSRSKKAIKDTKSGGDFQRNLDKLKPLGPPTKSKGGSKGGPNYPIAKKATAGVDTGGASSSKDDGSSSKDNHNRMYGSFESSCSTMCPPSVEVTPRASVESVPNTLQPITEKQKEEGGVELVRTTTANGEVIGSGEYDEAFVLEGNDEEEEETNTVEDFIGDTTGDNEEDEAKEEECQEPEPVKEEEEEETFTTESIPNDPRAIHRLIEILNSGVTITSRKETNNKWKTRQYQYVQTLELGDSKIDIDELAVISRQLLKRWRGDAYHPLDASCYTFVSDILGKLGIIPDRVNPLKKEVHFTNDNDVVIYTDDPVPVGKKFLQSPPMTIISSSRFRHNDSECDFQHMQEFIPRYADFRSSFWLPGLSILWDLSFVAPCSTTASSYDDRSDIPWWFV